MVTQLFCIFLLEIYLYKYYYLVPVGILERFQCTLVLI